MRAIFESPLTFRKKWRKNMSYKSKQTVILNAKKKLFDWRITNSFFYLLSNTKRKFVAREVRAVEGENRWVRFEGDVNSMVIDCCLLCRADHDWCWVINFEIFVFRKKRKCLRGIRSKGFWMNRFGDVRRGVLRLNFVVFGKLSIFIRFTCEQKISRCEGILIEIRELLNWL